MNPIAYLWILNLILVVDWAKNKRPTFWLAALVLFGPIGALAYLIYFYEQINFPIEVAKTIRRIRGKKVLRECPRCGGVSELVAHVDGRQQHFMCELCVERTFVEPHRPEEVVKAAQSILSNFDD